jgi:hypothetical protein
MHISISITIKSVLLPSNIIHGAQFQTFSYTVAFNGGVVGFIVIVAQQDELPEPSSVQ